MSTAHFMSHTRQPLSGLAAEAQSFAPWFHNVHLPDGTCTAPEHPLGDFPAFKWAEIGRAVPEDLRGWTALDIGCNSGFYSVELARRGARVTALDKDPHFLQQARWVVQQFGLGDRIEVVQGQVYDLAHWAARFDLVLFMGVFYHLRYPLLALDLVAERTNRLLMFQTLTMPGTEVVAPPPDLALDERGMMQEGGWPKMAFIEHSLEGDPTNWWAPNHACIEALLRSAGFAVTGRPGHEMYLCAPSARPRTGERGWDPDELLSATGCGGSVGARLRDELNQVLNRRDTG
jgi:tRNA (mo5U34)-methyltransferase